jgi:hypothetical protein
VLVEMESCQIAVSCDASDLTSMVPVRCYGFSLFISEGALLRFFFVHIQRNIAQSKSELM